MEVKPLWQLNGSRLYQGHILDVLKALPAESVHCIVTSPPYWGLRDYGLPPVEWLPVRYRPMPGLEPIHVPGCIPWCEHEWGEERIISNSAPRDHNGAYAWGDTRGQERQRAGTELKASQGQWCLHCGGWRGSLGLEPTIEMYVGHLVQIWRALWRVLREDGTCWLNLGDSYASSGQMGGTGSTSILRGAYDGYQRRLTDNQGRSPTPNGLKPKDLCAIPWRVALALQADGWYLRSDIVWAKGVSFCDSYSGSCMPESVRDRPTKGHEYLFLLAKSKAYFYDVDAVREALTPESQAYFTKYKVEPRTVTEHTQQLKATGKGDTRPGAQNRAQIVGMMNPAGRNLRSVWVINPQGYSKAHFATFPPALVEPCIKAGTSEKGCCPQCGKPWERVIQKGLTAHTGNTNSIYPEGSTANRLALLRQAAREHGNEYTNETITIGWIPTCPCYGVEIPPKLHLPDMPEEAVEPFVCEKCGGSGLEAALPLMPVLQAPCRKCKGKGAKPGNALWQEWQAECEEIQASRLALLERIRGLELPTVSCTVLDPFAGSGTVGEVAIQLRRKPILIELSEEYCTEHIIPRLEKPIQMEMAL